MSKWQETRREWLRKNPPDKDGNYTCAICKSPVHKDKVSLDHIISKSLYPELRYDLTNLQPTHDFCNQEKGNGKDGGTRVLTRYGINRAMRKQWRL